MPLAAFDGYTKSEAGRAQRVSVAANSEHISDRVVADAAVVYSNLSVPVLYEHAVRTGEGKLLEGGSFAVRSGPRTGRSPRDKFVVRVPETAEHVWWGAHNQPMSPETFEGVRARFLDYFKDKTLYRQDCYVSQDPRQRKTVRVISEQAYHSVFARTMFIPSDEPLHGDPDITILHAPFLHFEGQEDGLNSDAVIVLHLTEGLIVIAGTAYAGEMKKSVFTAMNYYLPLSGVLSLHSAANIDPATGKTAFFFGLSGTGKTTLSTDPDRVLIGDDEHAWTKDGIFNIEGGCYAKVIRLSEEAEPDIFATAHMFGTIMENVIFDEDSRVADLDDDAITENTRSSYPLDSLRNRYQGQVAPHPAHVILLTADAFGVLPPLARLTHDQALYHFLSGYTSKLAGTETGIDEPQVTFSTCFGAPFMALQPTLYADLLKERLEATGPGVWLVNTGWVGGPPGVGERVAIQETRKMVSAILNDAMVAEEFRTDPLFGFEVPLHCPGADASLLNPRDLWSDKDAYDVAYRALAERFHDNFDQFRPVAPPEVVTAGP